MGNLRSQKAYSFIVGYLMGVEDRVLSRDYAEDYALSGNFSKFKDVPQAELLRALSRVKQSFIRNHLLYSGVVKLSNVTKGFLDSELDIISKNGINLSEALLNKGNIYEVINMVTMHINLILPDVLEYLRVPYIKQVSLLFYLYNVDKQSVIKLLTSLKDSWSTLPHGIIVVRTNKISRELPFVLQNDRNLFTGTHDMGGASNLKDDVEIPPFAWGNVGTSLVGDVTKVSKETPIVETTKWQSISKGSAIYVDCDNMDIFNFLSMMEMLDNVTEEGSLHRIKLFVDSKASPLWSMVDNLLHGKYSYESIEVNRIKDTKSVVDVVMTAHITRDVTVNGYKDIGILSSDSDFYGLIEFLEGLNIYVGYNGKDTSTDYLHYLTTKGCVNFNMENLTMYDRTKEHKTSFISRMCLNHMATLPMAKWLAPEVSDWMVNYVGKDIRYSQAFKREEVEEIVATVFENLKMEMSGSKVILRSLGAEVAVALGSS